ncbi:MAG: universal stress protein [Deltaproteobacteria bacterium]|nr:universal stress protein [Deltaproteobacteria bacterium]
MKGIKKILVPLDFSECSKHALYYALDIAAGGAELFILHVIDIDLLDTISNLNLCSKEKAKKLMEKHARSEFGKLRKESAKKISKTISKEIIEDGIPFPHILRKARDLNVDLIIMGSFGTSSPMKRLFFGSTTEKVLRGSQIPVLCIPLPQVIEG